MKHKDRLSVDNSIEHYGDIDPLLVEQYKVEEFPGLLLSPRCSRKKRSFVTCSHCHSGLSKTNEGSDSLIKFWIGNNLIIVHIPEIFLVKDDDGKTVPVCITSKEDDECATDTLPGNRLTAQMCAAIAPVRPHAYIFAYKGGCHQTIKGNFQF